MNNTSLNNIPEFSVSDLAFSLKRTLEDTYGHVRVRGELSRVKVHTSGHLYSDLKDDKSVINVICWKGTMAKLSITPEEGMDVIITGRVSTYPARSNYQLIIETMELAGEGALLKLLEDRKKKLAAEGLFEPSRKKTLPFLPARIGVITSPTGAVIRDIMHRLNDRFPRHVLLWPVLVQGNGAADQVARAIDGFNAMDASMRPDLLIVARGGGSLEDLMPFNEENVVRAVANSSIPIISAIGHETDTTLIDLAADLRAPTPTGAAEMAVPRRMDLSARMQENTHRLTQQMNRIIDQHRDKVHLLSTKLGDPLRFLEQKTQGLDHQSHKLSDAFKTLVSKKREQTIRLSGRLQSPAHFIDRAAQSLKSHGAQLRYLSGQILKDPAQRLSQAGRMLESLSYTNVLERGFVLIRNDKGAPITRADDTKDGQRVTLTFKENKQKSAIIGDGMSTPSTLKVKSNPKSKHTDPKQEQLF